jgi:hypothetical protein
MNITIKKTSIFYTFLTILLIIIAGLRLFGWANDTANYYEIVIFQDELLLGSKEIFFRLIIFLNTEIFSSNFTVFLLLFAVLGVSIKIFALVKLSPLPALSIVLYLLSYFWLHEYIQIRAGVATAIFLLATKDLADGNSKKYFLKAFLAIMFHWSSIIMIPIYCLVKYKNLKAYTLLPIIGIILNILNVNFYLIIEFILNTTGIDPIFYKMYTGYQNDINVFNLISLSYILVFYIITAVIFTHKNTVNDYETILYKIISIGIFIFFLVSLLNAPVVAFRLLEYFMIVLLLLIPFLVIKFKQKLFASVLAIAYYSLYCHFLFTNVFEFERGIL